MITQYCEKCGKPRQSYPSKIASRFCSLRCKALVISKATAGKRREAALSKRDIDGVIQPRLYRLIPVTKGALAKVDIEDYEDMKRIPWCLSAGYARYELGQMHRIILERKIGRKLTAEELTDHSNHDRLDNRRANLRIATEGQNRYNTPRKLDKNTGFRGVKMRQYRYKKSFYANICCQDKAMYLGSFKTAEEAAYIYDQFAIALHGEFAILNILKV